MIKIEHVVTASPEQLEFIIEGMRNPMNSWDKSDSRNHFDYMFEMGDNDLALMKNLAKAGSSHRKFMRMMPVYIRVTAPTFWLAELDTYKIGTVRNSCSFMHKGMSKEFTIDDFSVNDEKIYQALRNLERKEYSLIYPYETDEYKTYTDINNRTYRVYRNGRIIREAFDYVDNYGTGRKRHYEEGEPSIYQTYSGYFVVKLSGRRTGHISLHRLVAELWCEKGDGALQVNHKNTNKGDNSAENLEWVTPKDNMSHAIENDCYDNLDSLHRKYLIWKNSSRLAPPKRTQFLIDSQSGFTHKQLADKYGLTPSQANNVRSNMKISENEELFQDCYHWETIIAHLNELRRDYLETKDEKIFQMIRCLLPSGYLQTANLMLNYEVLAHIYHERKNHRLDEWKTFCKWIETLPYNELITGEE